MVENKEKCNYVIKRSGQKEKFNPEKIKKVLKAAFKNNSDIDYDELTESVKVWDGMSIEDIQDQVIETLRNYSYNDVADEYLIYRIQKEEIRKYIQENIDYMLEYINSNENAATSSATDANANVTLKNVANLESETPKEKNRLIQRAWMKKALSELYPELTKQYEEDLNNHIIYAHDEASTPTIKNYCEAVSLYPLMLSGTSTLDGTGTKPPQHLSTFAGQICNLLFLLSSQCKGAVAFGEFFNFFDYYAAKDFGKDYHKDSDLYADSEFVKNRKTIGQKIDQTFQQIVYYWNQPASNRGSQSPSKFLKVSFLKVYFVKG